MKSGALPVFATPAMVALMEEAACKAIEKCLENDEGTVGIKMNVEHIAPTALNDVVVAKATLIKIEGRKFDYECAFLSVRVRKHPASWHAVPVSPRERKP